MKAVAIVFFMAVVGISIESADQVILAWESSDTFFNAFKGAVKAIVGVI